MTIREMEFQTGMTRANIRFYESEGLIVPARGENGYRNYSQDDLELLKKIKLLRMLDMPIDEIRAVLQGERVMQDILDVHIDRLSRKLICINDQIDVCRAMRADHADFATMDAQRYMDAIGRQAQLESDVIPRVRAPWRRYLARSFDFSLYAMLFQFFLYIVGRVSPLHDWTGVEEIICDICAMAMMLFIEPFLISRFGTTPGKALFGLHVTDIGGGRLSYSAAFSRTAGAMWRGSACLIPIYAWVRRWKSYVACRDGEALPWEGESLLELRDRRVWRWFAYVGAIGAKTGLTLLICALLLVPPNRGALTIAEFAENYNFALRVLEIDALDGMTETGEWVDLSEEKLGYLLVDLSGDAEEAEFEFETEDGNIRAVCMNIEANGEEVVGHPGERFIPAIYAFVRAQEAYGLFADVLPEAVVKAAEMPLRSFEDEVCGVWISCTVENEGYADAAGMWYFIPDEDPVPEAPRLSIRFEMRLVED